MIGHDISRCTQTTFTKLRVHEFVHEFWHFRCPDLTLWNDKNNLFSLIINSLASYDNAKRHGSCFLPLRKARK